MGLGGLSEDVRIKLRPEGNWGKGRQHREQRMQRPQGGEDSGSVWGQKRGGSGWTERHPGR